MSKKKHTSVFVKNKEPPEALSYEEVRRAAYFNKQQDDFNINSNR